MTADINTSTVDANPAEILARQVEISRRLLTLKKECGIAFYRPHWHQHCYHASTAKRRGFFAANRVGKSQGSSAETVAWMLGERPWYKTPFDVLTAAHDGGKNRRTYVRHHHPGGDSHPLVRSGIPPWPTKQLIVTTNWDKVNKIWTSQDAARPGKFWELCPSGFVKKIVRNHEGVIDEIFGNNGSYLNFMSVDAFKRNKQIAESSDWDRVAIDEPCPQALWKGVARGLTDRDGQGDFTLTSLEEVWIYDYFNLDELPADSADVCRDRFSLRAEIWDNPHLTDIGIARFEAELNEEEKECRLRGVPLELSGLIYKDFRRDVHVLPSLPEGWRDFHLPPNGRHPDGSPLLDSRGNPDLSAPRYVLYARVDTHPVNPHAVLFAAIGPSEIPIICHEIYRPFDADSLADAIVDYVKSTGCFLAGIKVEPAAWQKDPVTRQVSIAQRLAAKGLFIRPASKDLSGGISVVKSALRRRNPPAVLFAPSVRRTLWEFARYRYNPETGNPVDEEDHMMENLYRLLIDRTPYFDPDRAGGEPIPDAPFESADLSPIV